MTLFVDKLRLAVKLVMPRPLRRIAREYLSQGWDAKYEGRSVEEIFLAIYGERKWGTKSDSDFSSGSGSHIQSVVSSYVNAVRGFLESLPCPPSVVDLGCGDFNVGKQLRPYCGRYVACDVVPALIQRNKLSSSACKWIFAALISLRTIYLKVTSSFLGRFYST